MGKTTRDLVRDARADVAKAIARSMRALQVGLSQRTNAEIRAGFNENQKTAPMWVHASMRLGAAYITSQGSKTAPSERPGLAVVVVAPAASVDAWQQQADAFRIATAPKAKPLDVLAVPVATEPVAK